MLKTSQNQYQTDPIEQHSLTDRSWGSSISPRSLPSLRSKLIPQEGKKNSEEGKHTHAHTHTFYSPPPFLLGVIGFHGPKHFFRRIFIAFLRSQWRKRRIRSKTEKTTNVYYLDVIIISCFCTGLSFSVHACFVNCFACTYAVLRYYLSIDRLYKEESFVCGCVWGERSALVYRLQLYSELERDIERGILHSCLCRVVKESLGVLLFFFISFIILVIWDLTTIGIPSRVYSLLCMGNV